MKIPSDKREDLSGKRFGSLTVECPIWDRNRIYWLCQCECGNERIVRENKLIKGKTKSCGCKKSVFLKHAKSKVIPIGTRYGSLIVASHPILEEDNSRLFFLCKCDCGKEKVYLGTSLRIGHVKSCGCYQKKRASEANKTHGLARTKIYHQYLDTKRRELKKKLDNNWTLEMTRELFALQPKCILCESVERLQVDHAQPLSKGFGLKPGNAVVLCKSCNSSKKAKLFTQLKPEIAEKIQEAAKAFEIYWEDLN